MVTATFDGKFTVTYTVDGQESAFRALPEAGQLFGASPGLLASLCEFLRWEAEEPNTGEPTEEQAGRYMAMLRRAIEAVKKAGVTDLGMQP